MKRLQPVSPANLFSPSKRDGDEIDGEWDTGTAAAAEPFIPSKPPVARVHIKKRALRNKALSVGFDEKQLQDFVGGFNKRKKRRRKIAERQLLEKERLRRINIRKQRKIEKEMALNRGSLPQDDESQEAKYPLDQLQTEDNHQNESSSISETKKYCTGDMTITVTTREISRHVSPAPTTKPNPKHGLRKKIKKGNDKR